MAESQNHVLSSPKTAHYIAGWPRESDLGVIAESNEERIGAAWLRFLPADDPGYGFVGPEGYRIVDSSDRDSDTMVKDLA